MGEDRRMTAMAERDNCHGGADDCHGGTDDCHAGVGGVKPRAAGETQNLAVLKAYREQKLSMRQELSPICKVQTGTL